MAKKSLPQRGDSRKDIDDMSLQEIMAYNKELRAKLNRMLAERTEGEAVSTKPFNEMSADERRQTLDELRTRRNALLAQRDEVQPDPQSVPERKAKLPTKRMRKTVEAFDAMTDSEQLDSLRAMW